MTKFKSNVAEVLGAKFERETASSELPVTILLIVAFALAAIATANWISTAALNKAADVAACIEGSSSLATGNADNCRNTNHASKGDNSFTKDAEYSKRFNDAG